MTRNGSYILNDVLQYLAHDHSSALGHTFRNMLAKDRAQFFSDILKIGRKQDCNNSDVMSFIGRQYGFCYRCEQHKKPPETQESLSDHKQQYYLCEDCEK